MRLRQIDLGSHSRETPTRPTEEANGTTCELH
jgi:hypothetical protein